jgi:hypothetical protein
LEFAKVSNHEEENLRKQVHPKVVDFNEKPKTGLVVQKLLSVFNVLLYASRFLESDLDNEHAVEHCCQVSQIGHNERYLRELMIIASLAKQDQELHDAHGQVAPHDVNACIMLQMAVML